MVDDIYGRTAAECRASISAHCRLRSPVSHVSSHLCVSVCQPESANLPTCQPAVCQPASQRRLPLSTRRCAQDGSAHQGISGAGRGGKARRPRAARQPTMPAPRMALQLPWWSTTAGLSCRGPVHAETASTEALSRTRKASSASEEKKAGSALQRTDHGAKPWYLRGPPCKPPQAPGKPDLLCSHHLGTLPRPFCRARMRGCDAVRLCTSARLRCPLLCPACRTQTHLPQPRVR